MVQAIDQGKLEFLEKFGEGTRAHGMGSNGYHVDEVADCSVKLLVRASDGRHANNHVVLAGVAMQLKVEEAQEDEWQGHTLGFGQGPESPGQLG